MSSKTDRRLKSRRSKRGKARTTPSQARRYKERRDTIEKREPQPGLSEAETQEPEPEPEEEQETKVETRPEIRKKKAGDKKLKKSKKKSKAKVKKRRRTAVSGDEEETSEPPTILPGEIAAAAEEVTTSASTGTFSAKSSKTILPGAIAAAAKEATQEMLLSRGEEAKTLSGLLFPQAAETSTKQNSLFEDCTPKLLFEGIDFNSPADAKEEPLSTAGLERDQEHPEEDEDEPLLARAENLYDGPQVSYTFSYEPPTSTPEPGVAAPITNVAEPTTFQAPPPETEEPLLREPEPTTRFDPSATRSALVAEAASELDTASPKYKPTSRPRAKSSKIKLRGDASRFQVHYDRIQNNWQDWPVTRALMRVPRDAYAGVAVFCVACVLAVTLATGDKPPQALTMDPKPTPTPTQTPIVAASTPAISSPAGHHQVPVVSNPSQWKPPARSYSDESLYGYLPGYRETKNLRNPILPSIGSISNGRKVYEKNCLPCHGASGKPNRNLRVPPRNLNNPYDYEYGNSDAAIYRSVSYGFPRSAMGRYRDLLTEQELWDVVNFVKSLQQEVR